MTTDDKLLFPSIVINKNLKILDGFLLPPAAKGFFSRRMEVPPPKISFLILGPIISFTLKKKQYGSANSLILRKNYKQTYKQTSLL